VIFSVHFPDRRLRGTSVLGSGFSGVSPTSFSGCAFFMSSLEPDLCYSAGSFMTCAFLWWRSLEIGGFGDCLLQSEVPDEGTCLQFTHAGADDNFFSMPVSFSFCLFFCSQFAFVILNCYWTICWHSS
jgi:hypothetical protein